MKNGKGGVKDVTEQALHFFVNPLHPKIRMHFLHTVLYTSLEALIRRICLTIKNAFSWWSLIFFLYSCDLNVWFRVDNVRRNWMLVILRAQRINIIYAFWLVHTYDLWEDGHMDGITIDNVFLFYQIKQIDCMLLCVCFRIDHRRHQNVVYNIHDTLGCTSCTTF